MKTLVEAMILVIIVMFVFLQSWRATLVPAIAIPVVLLGTFGVLYALDFSINTMTLFGLVLAIGLLVDDAIVVVENVERMLEENPEPDPARSDHHVDGPDPDGAGRHRADPVRRVPADGLLRRLDRRHLPAILGDHRLGDGAVGLRRDDLEPGDRAQVLRPKRQDAEVDARLKSRFGRAAEFLLRARDGFNSGFKRLLDWYVARSALWSTASGGSSPAMPWSAWRWP